MLKKLLGDKQFYRRMIAIAIPIALQNLISSSLNMMDTVIIGRLGEANIAAVGLANQFYFLLNLLLFGTYSGTSIFISQFWGKKDIQNIRRVLGIALFTGVSISIVFSAAAFFAPGFIMGIFSRDQVVINLGSKFLKIVSISFVIMSISFAFSFSSRSIGQVKLPTVISAISLGINSLLNYLMIYGALGFPALGIRGSAIATDIARLVEMVLLLSIIYKRKNPLAASIHEMLDLKFEFIRTFFKKTIPVILNEGLWSLGTTMYSVAYARIGTDAIAAVQISGTIQNLFMVACFGLGNACAVMIGNEIGAKNEDKAISYAERYSIIGPTLGIILGTALVIAAPVILKLFNVSETVRYDAFRVLIVFAAVMSIKTFNIILVVGILRSGGDTLFSLFLEGGSMWIVGVPMAFLGALVWRLPVYWVTVLVALEEVIKASIGIPRVISKKWVGNVVEYM